MSFGLNKILKIILPKSLFYRALIIVAAPVVLLQIIITIVFGIHVNLGIRHLVWQHHFCTESGLMLRMILSS